MAGSFRTPRDPERPLDPAFDIFSVQDGPALRVRQEGLGNAIEVIGANGALVWSVGRTGATKFSGARVYSNADLSIPNATDTALVFNAERYNTGGYHSIGTNPTRIIAPITGYYHVGAGLVFETNATGRRYLTILINGTTKITNKALAHPLDFSSVDHRMVDTVATDYFFNAGDYFEAIAFQDSGAPLNAPATPNQGPEAWIHLIGS